ncbi:hypothetical protein Cgig2_026634 [Carnegiea gigantea]|uniref:Aminotransferase-like plant mobile domain-containing protein n=1 Tax=Carnegiea gigantea TaxID=171969 RepID=A0A9Q1K474_9CARY|nr:hypothetical protein Cgig2_026634 [Carnegiea gigantea]
MCTAWEDDPISEGCGVGTALRLVLEYGEMAMERHLTLTLIKSWDRRRKAFRIAGREVRFTVFDIVMFTSLPGTGTKVELDGKEVSTEVGNMVRAPYGAAWSLLHYVDDVDGMGQYAWAEAIWQVVVESIEDTQRKLARGPLSEVQLNGLCLLIQVWFYEHTTRFSDQDGERFPQIASWRKVDHGGIRELIMVLTFDSHNKGKNTVNVKSTPSDEE